MSDDNKLAEAKKIVRNYSIGSLATAVMPVPLAGIGVLAGVQVLMLRKLAGLYDVKFSEQSANASIGTLCGVSVAGTVGGLLRAFGGPLAIVGVAGSAASTYALGQVFTKHFSSGGTFLNFDPEKARDDYEESYKEGKKAVVENFAGIKP